jgi:hypothetical protein
MGVQGLLFSCGLLNEFGDIYCWGLDWCNFWLRSAFSSLAARWAARASFASTSSELLQRWSDFWAGFENLVLFGLIWLLSYLHD